MHTIPIDIYPRLWEWQFCVPVGISSAAKHHDTFHHDDVVKWKHFPRYCPFVWEIHCSPVNSPHKGHWCGGLMFSLICAWINGWANDGEAGDLRCHRTHYDVTVMIQFYLITIQYNIAGNCKAHEGTTYTCLWTHLRHPTPCCYRWNMGVYYWYLWRKFTMLW